jgi:cytochrome c oxidase subunit IV
VPKFFDHSLVLLQDKRVVLALNFNWRGIVDIMMLKQGLILREIGVPVYERGALIINV